jgi:hypothetical protein
MRDILLLYQFLHDDIAVLISPALRIHTITDINQNWLLSWEVDYLTNIQQYINNWEEYKLRNNSAARGIEIKLSQSKNYKLANQAKIHQLIHKALTIKISRIKNLPKQITKILKTANLFKSDTTELSKHLQLYLYQAPFLQAIFPKIQTNLTPAKFYKNLKIVALI